MEKVHEFIGLIERKRGLEAALKDVENEIRSVEPIALEYMAGEGIQNCNVDGYTVYLQTQVWASLQDDRIAAIAALKDAGLEDMVQETVNSQTLSAWVREQEDGVPESLKPHLRVNEVTKLRMRKAS